MCRTSFVKILQIWPGEIGFQKSRVQSAAVLGGLTGGGVVDGWDHWMFNDYTWTSWHVGFSLFAQMLHVWIIYLYER